MNFIEILSEFTSRVKVKQFDAPLVNVVLYRISSEPDILRKINNILCRDENLRKASGKYSNETT